MRRLFPLVFLFFLPYLLSAYGTLNGNISGMTIPGGQTWYIDANLTVDAGTTVTIEPGAILKFGQNVNFYIYGDVVAPGMSSNRIYFTSMHDNTVGDDIYGSTGDPQPGNWYGIYLEGNGGFNYCTLRYGGSTYGMQDANIRIDNGTCTITNCDIQYSGYYGVYANNCSPEIQNSVISNNNNRGIFINQNAIPVLQNNTISGNNGYAVYLSSNCQILYGAITGNTGTGNNFNGIGLSGNLISSHLQGNPDFPFILASNVNIEQDQPLTISSGTVIKVVGSVALNVYSNIDVNGTAAEPVIFTSIIDDSYGGDTNNDEDATSPAPGDWFGINCDYVSEDAPGNGDFEYCRIRYAGNTYSSFDAGLFFTQSQNAIFHNSYIEYSGKYGMRVYLCAPVITENHFIGNLYNGIYVNGADTAPVINNNTFTGNQHYACWINGCQLISYSGNTGSGNQYNGFAVHGTINSDAVWTNPSDSFPFILNSTTTINNGASLTLPAGTLVKGDSNAEIYCYGTMDVNGTAEEPVVITSMHDDTYGGDTDSATTEPAPGDWNGIMFNGVNGNLGIGTFDFCRIRYGGNGYGNPHANIYFYYCDDNYFVDSWSEYSALNGVKGLACDINIERSEFNFNQSNGFYANGTNTHPHINDCLFQYNGDYAASLNGTNLYSYSGMNGNNNGFNGFAMNGTTTGEVTWTQDYANFPFILNGNLTIPVSSTLNLLPGTTVKVNSNCEIFSYGTLNAIGTEAEPIAFTSISDDTISGDTDNLEVTPTHGSWFGITFNGAGDYLGIGRFDWVSILYGGNASGTADANIRFNMSDSCYVRNSTLDYSGHNGLHCISCEGWFENNNCSNNTYSGIYSSGADAITHLTDNQCNDNGQYGIYINNGSLISYSGNGGAGNVWNGFALTGILCESSSWNSASVNYPFIHPGSITVPTNMTLEIAPGTVIKSSGIEHTINGTLLAQGSPEEPIVFTSLRDDTYGGDTNGTEDEPYPGEWRGYWVSGYGDAQGIVTLDNCIFRYGGNTSGTSDANLYLYADDQGSTVTNCTFEYSGKWGLRLLNSNATVENCMLRNNIDHGLYLSGNTIMSSINNNTFDANGNYGAYLQDALFNSYSGNTGSGNAINGFGVSGICSGNIVWSTEETSFPYILAGTVTVSVGDTLTFAPGAVTKGTASTWFAVNGCLIAETEGREPIIFTSLKDDTVGGDTNSDADATEPLPGDWYGIQHNSGSHGQYDGAILQYAGNTASVDANIYFNTATGWFRNGESNHSGQEGIRLNQSSIEITGSSFLENLRDGIAVQGGTSNPIINNNSFFNNGNFGVEIVDGKFRSYSGNSGSGNGYNGFGLRGTLEMNAEWSHDSDPNFPFIMTGAITINNGSVLTLPAGTTVKAGWVSRMTVYGTIDANGTSISPVVFTSIKDDSRAGDTDGDNGDATAGNWDGIYVYGNGENDGIGQFDHCIIAYGGNSSGLDGILRFYDSEDSWFNDSLCEYSAQHGIRIEYASPEISGSYIRNNLLHGIYCQHNTSKPAINDNEFTDNGSYAVYLENALINSCGGNSGSGNSYNGFGVAGTVTGNVTWEPGGVTFPYILAGNVYVEDDATFNLSPAVVVKGAPNSLLYVYGTMQVSGTDGNEVTFTSLKDDTICGDTNNDADATEPAPGDWAGIYVVGDAGNVGLAQFDYCDIRYGGNTSSIDANLRFLNADSACSFNHGSCNDSQQYGIWIGTTNLTVRNSIIADNLDYGVLIQGYCHPNFGNLIAEDMGNNYIHDNDGGEWQIMNNSSYDINAYYNIWAYSDSLTIDSHLYDNDENVSYGAVLFNPWQSGALTAPQNLMIIVESDEITLTWDAVPGAVSYKVYHSQDPYTENWGVPVAMIAATHWEPPVTQTKGYYLVTASNEPIRSQVVGRE